MKKIVSILVVALVMVGSFSGCSKAANQSDNKSETKPNAQTQDKDGEVKEENSLAGKTVTVGIWGGNDAETAAFNKMTEEFTEATGIKVEERIYADFNQELQAEIIGGTAPDIFYVDAYMAPFYISQGVLLELEPSEFELDQFYEPLKDSFEEDGKYYAVSKDYSTLAMYYNKKYVNKEDIPGTLEELLGGDFLTNLKATLPEDVVPMTYNQDLARNMFIAQADGDSVTKDDIYSNIGSESIIKNLAILYDVARTGIIKTAGDIGLGWNGDAFGNEKTAIMVEGNWVLGHLKENFSDVDFGTVEIPTYKGKKGSMVFTVGYAINAATKNVDVATAFIKYATGEDGMTTWTQGAGVLPSREDVATATNVAKDELKVPHIEAANYATPWQKGTTMDTINHEYQNYIPSVITGERTLEEALKLAEKEANSTIEANQ